MREDEIKCKNREWINSNHQVENVQCEMVLLGETKMIFSFASQEKKRSPATRFIGIFMAHLEGFIF